MASTLEPTTIGAGAVALTAICSAVGLAIARIEAKRLAARTLHDETLTAQARLEELLISALEKERRYNDDKIAALVTTLEELRREHGNCEARLNLERTERTNERIVLQSRIGELERQVADLRRQVDNG